MKYFFINVGKTLCALLMFFVLLFLSYVAYVFLYSLFAYGYFPNRISPEIARISMVSSTNANLAPLLMLVLLFWSKRQSFAQRLISFIIIYIPLLLFFAIVSNFILGNFLTSLISLSVIIIYNKLLNKKQPWQIRKFFKMLFTGEYLHHHGLSRLCIVIGVLLILCTFFLCIKEEITENLFILLAISLMVYFIPFFICVIYYQIVYKIFLWIQTGFKQP